MSRVNWSRMRIATRVALAFGLTALVGWAALAQTSQPDLLVTDARGETFEAVGPITVEQLGPVLTTTTSVLSTTTTQLTTTTQPVPAYIDLGTLQSGEGYEIVVNNIDDPNTTVVEPSFGWFDANYFFDLPYQEGYGWSAGDRCAYRSAYGFLHEGASLVGRGAQWDLDGGEIIGRFTFTRTGGYIQTSDGFMREGVRHYDGTLDWQSSVSPEPGFNECPEPEVIYEPYTGPDERPTIAFRNGAGEVVEVRSYPHTQIKDPRIKFRLIDGDGSDGRVAVVAYLDDLPGVVVYYDALGQGSVEANL